VPLVLAVAWIAASSAFPDGAAIVWVAAAGLVFQQWADLARVVCISRGRFGLAAAHAVVENTIWLVVIAAFLEAGRPLLEALEAGLICFAASVLVGLAVLRYALAVRPAMPTLRMARDLAREAPYFSLFAVLTSTNAQGRRAVAVALTLGVVLVVDVALLPRLGIAAAVIGSAAATLALVAGYLVGLSRISESRPLLLEGSAPLVAATGGLVAG